MSRAGGWAMQRQQTHGLGRVLHDDETDVDREIARNLWKHHRMFPPGSRFKHYWDYAMVCLVLYNCILTPMQLGYFQGKIFLDSAIVFITVDACIWLLFAADVLVNFRTSFYDEDHQIVLSARVVANRYRQGWFLWDLFATLPYHLIGALVTLGSPGHIRMLTVAICKIPSCMRLVRLVHKLFELSSVGYFRVVLQMFGFIMVAHWVACIWWMIGESSYDMAFRQTLGFEGTSWLLRVPLGSTPLDRNISITPFPQQYMSSLYWSLTTLMKTPWVGPDTVIEKVYASMMVVLGATLFAVLLGNVTAMINTYNKRHSELRDQLTTLHTFATFRRVPAGLQRKMFAYVDAYWNMTAGLDHSSILNSLPPRLRGSVLLAIHGGLLRECLMLRNCSEECAKTLLLKARPQVTLQKEDLLVPGQLCTDVYVLVTGSLQITLPTAEDAGDEQLAAAAADFPPTGACTGKRLGSCPPGVSTADAKMASRTTDKLSRTTGKGAAAASSSHLKGERLRFRVVEKPGQIVGLSEPFQQPSTYPFRVTALKTSQMVYLQRQDLANVLSVFHGADADNVCQVLRSDFLMCWETLKPRAGQERNSLADSFMRSADAAGIAAKQARELGELREKLSDFSTRVDSCMQSLSTVQAQTAVLPQMQSALKALVKAHTSAS